jgi:hypothetical protein
MFSGICTKPVARAAALVPAFIVLAIGIGAGHATPLSDNDEVRESVVRLEVDKGKTVMQGTGFILNDRGYVATNHHVIEGAKTIFLTFLAAGKPTAVPAQVVVDNPEQDMAIVQATGDLFGEPVVLANYDTNPPAKVTAVGYPGAADLIMGGAVQASVAFEPSYSSGTIARILPNAKVVGNAKLIQQTAVINPGNSGGPLFDECGRVIGINTLRLNPEKSEFAQGIFYAIDIRDLEKMLDDNLIAYTSVSKPCTGSDSASDIAPATTKEAEAVVFDRFAACIKARPCDRNLCKSRYTRRVSPELASAHQADVDLRMTGAEPRCTEQKENDAFLEFRRCATNQPCEFDKVCTNKVTEALSAESLKKRRTLMDRMNTTAQEDCRQAKAPNIWRGAETEKGIWLGTVSNESGAALIIACDVAGADPGNGVILLSDVKGKRDRWTGSRDISMTIDTFVDSINLDLKTEGESLSAGTKHVEGADTRGWLKDVVGMLGAGGVVTFEDPKIDLDETFTLKGARDTLAPCLKARYIAQQQQQQDSEAQQ